MDTDGNGVGNNADPDDDGDGVVDGGDALPLDPTVAVDTDGDSIDDCVDPDDDGDGVDDGSDAFTLDQTETADADSDGEGNCVDLDADGDNFADVAPAGSSSGILKVGYMADYCDENGCEQMCLTWSATSQATVVGQCVDVEVQPGEYDLVHGRFVGFGER